VRTSVEGELRQACLEMLAERRVWVSQS